MSDASSDGQTLSVTVAEIRTVAADMGESAGALGSGMASVAVPVFDTSGAGRKYTDLGSAYADAYDGLGRAVGVWRATTEHIGSALTDSMNDYESQDAATADALGAER